MNTNYVSMLKKIPFHQIKLWASFYVFTFKYLSSYYIALLLVKIK